MRFGRKTSFVAGALVALVIGSGSAYAATGGKFILGYGNSAGKTSTLSNPNGTALALNSKAGTPSLKVNRNIKVPNLNSDLLDGMDQTRFALTSASTRVFYGTTGDADSNQNGQTDTLYSYANCPAGWQRTGGGHQDTTSTGFVWWTSPETAHRWVVIASVDEEFEDFAGSLTSYVVCFHPRGGGNAAGFRPAPTATNELTSEQLELAARRAAARNN